MLDFIFWILVGIIEFFIRFQLIFIQLEVDILLFYGTVKCFRLSYCKTLCTGRYNPDFLTTPLLPSRQSPLPSRYSGLVASFLRVSDQ